MRNDRHMFNARHSATEMLYLCTRAQLTDNHRTAIAAMATAQPLDWSDLLAIADSHGVAPLLFTNLQQVGLDAVAMPAAVRTALQQATYRNIAVKAGIAAKLVQICAFCAQQGVDVMALKGTALDQVVYAQSWYVEHDVDLLLRPRAAGADA